MEERSGPKVAWVRNSLNRHQRHLIHLSLILYMSLYSICYSTPPLSQSNFSLRSLPNYRALGTTELCRDNREHQWIRERVMTKLVDHARNHLVNVKYWRMKNGCKWGMRSGGSRLPPQGEEWWWYNNQKRGIKLQCSRVTARSYCPLVMTATRRLEIRSLSIYYVRCMQIAVMGILRSSRRASQYTYLRLTL